MLMSYKFGESGVHKSGLSTVNENSPFVVHLCVVLLPEEPRGVTEISTSSLPPLVVIMPLTRQALLDEAEL